MDIKSHIDAKDEVLDINKEVFSPFFTFLFVLTLGIFILLFFLKNLNLPVDTGLLYLILTPTLIGLISWTSSIYSKVEWRFWRTIAKKYDWEYSVILAKEDLVKEKSLLFSAGNKGSGKATNLLRGLFAGHPFSMFKYFYSSGSGKSKTSYILTVFEFKFTGSFPHLYLDSKRDWHSSVFSSSNLANISLPPDFTEAFRLYSPKEYEIETLQILTPDILKAFIDMGFDYDLEIVDGEMIVYSHRIFNNFDYLDKELKRIEKVVALLAPKLNNFKITQVGDLPFNIKRGFLG